MPIQLLRRRLLQLLSAGSVGALLPTVSPAQGAEQQAEPAKPRVKAAGEFRFLPTAAEGEVPERFRLQKSAPLAYQMEQLPSESKAREIWELTFPSAVKTPFECNNTVHGEYYLPKQPLQKPMPAVVVLHILGGDFVLSRLFCNALAGVGVAALFVKLPYYGPRRPPNSSRRMISPNPQETVEGMTQGILDIRYATQWLASRDEVDAKRLGIFGISLGGITGGLAVAIEPRISCACLMLAGADLGKVAWESTELNKIRQEWLQRGGSREDFMRILKVIDPAEYGARAQAKRLLMLNALKDEVIPKACTESLWQSLGQPPIIWYTGGHYSVIAHLPSAILQVQKFFR